MICGSLLCLLLISGNGFTGLPEVTDPPPGTPQAEVYRPTPKPRGDFEVLTLPLRKVGNLLLIEAEIDSMRGNFILDLGAPCLVLNSTYFRNYQIEQNYYASSLNETGIPVRQTQVKRLQVLDLYYKNISAEIADLGAIENQRHVQILGLMGVNLFKEFVFELNVQDLQLTLYRDPENLRIPDTALFQVPLRTQGDHLVVQGLLNGKKLRLGLDTGAEMNLLDNHLSGKVFENMEILYTRMVRGANGGRSELLVTRLKGLTMEGVELQEMRTLVGSMQKMGKAYGTSLDGMLGYPFFAQGKTVINFRKRELKVYKWEASQ